MEGLLQELLTFVLLYKYSAIFLISFLAALSLPLPSSAILVASAFFASEGYLNLLLVFVTGTLGDIAGDLAAYWLARIYGKKLLQKIGLRAFLGSPAVREVEKKLAASPWLTVILSRFGTSITPIVSYLSGIAKVPHHKYAIAVVIGEIGAAALLCVAGFVFGDDWSYIENVMSQAGLVLIVFVLLIIVVLWKRRTRRAAAAHRT